MGMGPRFDNLTVCTLLAAMRVQNLSHIKLNALGEDGDQAFALSITLGDDYGAHDELELNVSNDIKEDGEDDIVGIVIVRNVQDEEKAA